MPIARPLSKEMILDAMNKTRSNRAAARYLACSYIHYKKYAKLYRDENSKTLFDKHLNRYGKGIPKFLSKEGFAGNIIDVIEGRIPIEHFTPQKIRDKLIVEGYLVEECAKCGWHERRISDYRMPLVLAFKDKNKRNYAIKNLELVCYNCHFLFVGDLFTEKQVNHLEDFVPVPKSQVIDWHDVDIDKNFEEHFKKLGIIQEEKKPEEGSEYISKI